MIARVIEEPRPLQRQTNSNHFTEGIPMILSISTRQEASIGQVLDMASKIATKTIEALTSEKAQAVYRFILTAIGLTVAVFVLFGLATIKAYREYARPAGTIVLAYGADKVRQGVRWSREQLAQWRAEVRRRMAAEWANAMALAMFAWQGI